MRQTEHPKRHLYGAAVRATFSARHISQEPD